MTFDFQVLYFIQDHLVNPFLNVAMPFVSFLGNAGMIWGVLTIVMIIVPRSRAYGIMMAIALVLTGITGELVMKPLIGRVRPCHLDLTVSMLIKRPTSFSFPSGHSASSFAAATMLLFYNKKAGVFAIVLAAMIAFSRLYLFVHFPTDVLAGILLGIVNAWIIYRVYKKFFYKKNREVN